MVAATSVRILVLGGFLGSGKTTAISRLAQSYAARNLRVGIITNDQADGLVDTAAFQSQGWTTAEVAGGCFCCRFNDLLNAADRILETHKPDVLLCEPVGSCTDIVATLIRPLKQRHADRFTVAPYVALLDPDRARQALSGEGRGGFSAKVTYIFQMQQHEADIIAINKIDTLSPEQRTAITALVRRNFPKAEIMLVSARTGEGFDRLTAALDRTSQSAEKTIDVDYDIYADGEARMGWLNCLAELRSATAFDADRWLLELGRSLSAALASAAMEPAHVKMLLRSGDAVSIVNTVGSAQSPELSRSSERNIRSAELLVNARVEGDPGALQNCVCAAVVDTMRLHGLEGGIRDLAAFAPSRPVPTHRILSPTAP